MLLPIEPDGAIDRARLVDQVDALVASGVTGLYTNGTAGEFYAQSLEETAWLSELVAERCCAARVPFQLGASYPTVDGMLERVRLAAGLRPDAIQVVLPDWTAPSDGEAADFLSRVADQAGGIPLVLYNPPHAKRVLAPEALATLARAVPTLVGAKVAWGDRGWLPAMLASVPGFLVFVPGHELASERARGAAGSYSNAACLRPTAAAAWWSLMERDPAAARELEVRLQRFLRQHVAPWRDVHGHSNQALDKLLAAVGGWADVGTRLRWPYRGVPEQAVPRVREVARRIVPEFVP